MPGPALHRQYRPQRRNAISGMTGRIRSLNGQPSPYDSDVVKYAWRGTFDSGEVELLHAECFDREPGEWDWAGQVERHSLGWVCARDDATLVGWVNVA